MTTALLITLLTLQVGLLHGQIADTCRRKCGYTFPNEVDAQGLKQGCWKTSGEKNGYFDSSGSLDGEGVFKDDKKIGTWKYVYNGGDFFMNEKFVTYYENGNVYEKNVQYDYDLDMNEDTSLISVNYYGSSDTLKLNCLNKKCLISYDDNEIKSFDYTDFDYFEFMLSRLCMGDYKRQLNLLKNVR